MDMITSDYLGATRRGRQRRRAWGKSLAIDEVANLSGTVGYELMCALAVRVPIIESIDLTHGQDQEQFVCSECGGAA